MCRQATCTNMSRRLTRQYPLTRYFQDIADPASKQKNTRAVEIIQRETDSTVLASRLRGEDDWQQQMSLEEACSVLNVQIVNENGKPTPQLALEVLLSFLHTTADLPSQERHRIATALDRLDSDFPEFELKSAAQNVRSSANQSEIVIPQQYPRGLKNIGNTCYLNSLLQLLNTIRPVREFAQSIREDRESGDASLSNSGAIESVGPAKVGNKATEGKICSKAFGRH